MTIPTVGRVTDNLDQPAVHTDRNEHALQGHDPVAYFTVGAPTKGNPNISRDWNGATWFFATAANRDLFDADPLAYAPAFGGHCAVGKALGMDLPGSAKRWRIDNGRLYLNKHLLAAAQFRLFARRIRRLAANTSRPTQQHPSIENPGVTE